MGNEAEDDDEEEEDGIPQPISKTHYEMRWYVGLEAARIYCNLDWEGDLEVVREPWASC
ncbi:hypothetical protein Sjap_019938 [Stephania japonica]|uniref:Uncharacterized protein n=1 Tax=Stephania japonica TaxID=461633 RepID=A0AAP0F8P0_9MAGN